MAKQGQAKGGARATWPPTAAPAHRYEIVETIEAGIELLGTEVKSLREARRSSATPTR